MEIRWIQRLAYHYYNDTETPRKEILINLDPSSSDFKGQVAIRSGDWKLITGIPNCSLVKYFKGDPCPDGWIHVDGTIEPPPYTIPFVAV